MSKTVIIGGVAAGSSCAARLRRLKEDEEIVLVERGEYISFANCGLPYYIGGAIAERENLLLMTAERMNKRHRIDVRLRSEVTAINREEKTVTIHDRAAFKMYDERYDHLLIATGSAPVMPPLPGIGSDRVESLWTVPDADRIKKRCLEESVHRAVIVGGGFIGLELAENLREAGLDVLIVEMSDQVLPSLDREMALLLEAELRKNGVGLKLGRGVTAFEERGGALAVSLNDGTAVETDLAVVAVGIRPNGQLAKEAGLAVNERGGIVVDAHLRTSDPAIYAAGDVIEVEEPILGGRTMIPLAGPANKQGRVAAGNIAGGNEVCRGSRGTAVAKVFGLTAASVGLTEKALAQKGLAKGRDYETVTIVQNSHAGYYPGAVPLTLKLLFAADGEKIFGAQIVGADGADKRIDTIAASMYYGGTVADLAGLELAYAPPYSSAKDPVNMAGFCAGNLLDGMVKFAAWDSVETEPDSVILDVREKAEVEAFGLGRAVHIPMGQLRERLNELDPRKRTIVFCAIGVRGYNAARLLAQKGFADVAVYPGGFRFYRGTHPDSGDVGENGGIPPCFRLK